MADKVLVEPGWPPAFLTSTKMPIQFYVDAVENPEHKITPEKRAETPWAVIEGDQAIGRLLYYASGVSRKGPYVVDVGWPGKFRIQPDLSSIDEGSCDLLHGLVRALRPGVVLETGTHKGRSTHAIATALCENERGVIYTLDCIKWVDLKDVLSLGEKMRCTQIVGVSPYALSAAPLGDLQGIDFAFLDGAHDGKTLLAEMAYVEAHRADTCIVCVDNALDSGWPEVRQALDSMKHRWHAILETMAGMDIITLCNSDPQAKGGATHHVVIEEEA